MTNDEILKKAIEKAWDTQEWPIDKFFHDFNEYSWTNLAFEQESYKYIFSKGFAKAFWGELATNKGICSITLEEADRNPVFWADCLCHRQRSFDIWQYHLQAMVLSPDPIRYLEQFLD